MMALIDQYLAYATSPLSHYTDTMHDRVTQSKYIYTSNISSIHEALSHQLPEPEASSALIKIPSALDILWKFILNNDNVVPMYLHSRMVTDNQVDDIIEALYTEVIDKIDTCIDHGYNSYDESSVIALCIIWKCIHGSSKTYWSTRRSKLLNKMNTSTISAIDIYSRA